MSTDMLINTLDESTKIETVQTEERPSTSSSKSEINENENNIDPNQSNETDVSKQLVEGYLKTLCHSVKCFDPNCRVEKCSQFKRIIQHSTSCKKVNSQCEYCRQLVALCVVHAKSCQDDDCHIPDCHAIRVKLASLQEFKAKSQSIIEFLQLNTNLLKHKKICDCQVQTDTNIEPELNIKQDENEEKRILLIQKIQKIKNTLTEKLTSREEKTLKFDRKIRHHIVKQIIETTVEKHNLKERNFFKSASYASLVVYFIKTENKLYTNTNNSDDYLILMSELYFNLENELSKRNLNKSDKETQVEIPNTPVKNKNSGDGLDDGESDNLDRPPSKRTKFEN